MRLAGKVWGQTEEVFVTPAFELHRLEIVGGHQCSKHLHATKYNGFFVESGEIVVSVWQPEGTLDTTTLEAGDHMVIPPGRQHRFEGIANVSVVYEAYWTELQRSDIVRADTGQ